MDNAVKYTRPGDRINVKLKNTARGGCALVVADTGIGVPKGDEEKIFDRFYRASNVGEIQGTGLGLAIGKDDRREPRRHDRRKGERPFGTGDHGRFPEAVR